MLVFTQININKEEEVKMTGKDSNLIEKVEKRMHSVGVDLTLIDSLISFLDIGLNEEIEVSKVDLANLTVVIRRLVKIVKSKYERIERILNI